MRKKFKHLSFTQRIQIETLLNRKVPLREIAETIGVHISTVYREVKRGVYEKKVFKRDYYETSHTLVKAYSPDIAENKYRYHLQLKGAPVKIGKDYKFADYIEDRIINGKLTPLSVLGEIKRKGLKFDTTVSVRTLYSYIYKGVFLNLSMKDLVFNGNRRKKRKRLSIIRCPKGTSIERRPAYISERNEFGHWEMDCVCSSASSGNALLVLTERLARKEIVFKIKRKNSENVVKCLNFLERKYGRLFGKIFKSITVDNGSEFSSFSEMQKSVFGNRKRTTIYYCHPYSSYERGTNERMNREIRRVFPKGTDFGKVSVSEVRGVENWLNNYPRRVLDFCTPNQIFDYHLSLIMKE